MHVYFALVAVTAECDVLDADKAMRHAPMSMATRPFQVDVPALLNAHDNGPLLSLLARGPCSTEDADADPDICVCTAS